jgi:hypothetical protein
MTRLRFSTAAQVADQFPHLHEELGPIPKDIDPLSYVQQLQKTSDPARALTFLAFLASRRDAVIWLCAALRGLDRNLPAEEAAILQTAEEWVKSPGETTRQRALDTANKSSKAFPATWAAMAAGWSGGNITKDNDHPTPPPQRLTGQFVKVAFTLRLCQVPESQQPQIIEDFVQRGVTLLKSETA